jgi:hypothetical protein
VSSEPGAGQTEGYTHANEQDLRDIRAKINAYTAETTLQDWWDRKGLHLEEISKITFIDYIQRLIRKDAKSKTDEVSVP